MDSHDTDRLFTRSGSEDAFFQQLALLFTLPGSPCIYYGTEVALPGGHDPDCRRCMPWDKMNTTENQQRIDQLRRLIALRCTLPELRDGMPVFRHAPGPAGVVLPGQGGGTAQRRKYTLGTLPGKRDPV